MLIYTDSEEVRGRAARVISEGGVVAFRTDTFYGLGADPFNVEALRAINDRRERGENLVLAAPALVETYSVLTRLPGGQRVPADVHEFMVLTNQIREADSVIDVAPVEADAST